MADLPPFIDDQRVLQLVATGLAEDAVWKLLEPERFRAARLRRTGERKGPGEEAAGAEPAADDERYWREVDRRELILDADSRRLCFVTDAGIGKSTMLVWAKYVFSREGGRRLPIWFELRDLSTKVDDYLPRLTADGRLESKGLLLRKFREGLSAEAAGTFDPQKFAGYFRQLVARGDVVLLVDAFDQTLGKSGDTLQKVEALRDFLAVEGKECRAIVAGRPHAIRSYRTALFASGSWTFAQVDHFSPEQAARYLGPERHQHLARLDVDVLSIPRALQAITRIDPTPEKLAALRTASDVYWHCIEAMFQKEPEIQTQFPDVFEAPCAPYDRDWALWLLSAIAFQMFVEDNADGVEAGDCDEFKVRVWEQRSKTSDLKKFQVDRDKFETYWRMLSRANEFLDHGFIDGDLKQIAWRNPSLREFFAAVWVTNYGTAADRQAIASRIYVQTEGRWERESSDRYWVWRFAAEMPLAQVAIDRWVALMAMLLQPAGPRSTEIMYRGYENIDQHPPPTKPGKPAARSLFEQQALAPYRAEFAAIERGDRGATLQRIAQELRAEFRPIVSPGQTLDFVYGEPAKPDRLERPFELACYQVTNEQYELFDPPHQDRRSDRSTEDRCPAVNVTWYDAWAFCAWLGPGYRLPTEREWECACRAGRQTTWSFGNEQSEIDKYAWTNENSGKGGTKRRAHPVGELLPNGFGLFDMHGNVWEWCESLRDVSVSARVFRGGSWGLDPRNARSAFRNWGTPSGSNIGRGFRVARALP